MEHGGEILHVYVIEERFNGQSTGLLKIGKSAKPIQRVNELRSGNPRELVIHSTFKCGKLAGTVEKIAHERLDAHRVNGEWFSVSLDYARACVEEIVREQVAAHPWHRRGDDILEPRRDSRSMLQSLPAVVDLRDLQALLGMSRPYAKNAASRWTTKGYLSPLGRRTGVYFNLIVDPNGPSSQIKVAVDKALKRPVVGIGAFALHQHGWTVHRPQLTEIAVPIGGPDRTMPQINGIIGVARRKGWFRAVLPLSEAGVDGFLCAPPEYALADAIMAGGADGLWKPDPSGIDLPSDVDPTDALRRIEEAAYLLNADLDQVHAFVSQIEAFRHLSPSP